MYQSIPTDSVVPADDNVRRKLGDVKELAASIASVGVIEPLLVTAAQDGRFTVVAGHRRLAAAQQAGLTEVPCVVKELSEVERLETMIAENLARQALSPIEEAQAYFRMVELAVPVKDLARRLGRPAKHITRRLSLLELPTKVQAKVERGALGVSDANALLALKDHPDVIADLVSDDWDTGDLERAVIREVTRIEADERRAAAIDALTAEGVRVIEDWDRYGHGAHQPAPLGNGHGEIALDPGKHASESCHAAHVTRNGQVVPLCTDPSRHRTSGGSNLRLPKGAAPSREEQHAAEREAARQRRALDRERADFTASLTTRRLPKADVIALVLGQFLASAGNAQAKAACALIGIEAEGDEFGAAHRSALVAHGETTAANRERAALALALALGEEAVRFAPDGRTAPARLHLHLLSTYGWGQPGDPTPDTDGSQVKEPGDEETGSGEDEEPFPA